MNCALVPNTENNLEHFRDLFRADGPHGARARRWMGGCSFNALFDAEEWRPVVGWEGFYEISNYGRLFRLERLTRRSNGRPVVHPAALLEVPTELRTATYVLAYLNAPGRRPASFTRHRLVLEAFVGPCPPDMVACHDNGRPRHNHVSNLRWDTPRANNLDRVRHEREHCFRLDYSIAR